MTAAVILGFSPITGNFGSKWTSSNFKSASKDTSAVVVGEVNDFSYVQVFGPSKLLKVLLI